MTLCQSHQEINTLVATFILPQSTKIVFIFRIKSLPHILALSYRETERRQAPDKFLYTSHIRQSILLLIMCVCVFSSAVFVIWNSRRHAAGVCAGDAWQERSSPRGSEDCHVDRSTPGPRRPAQVCKQEQTLQ